MYYNNVYRLRKVAYSTIKIICYSVQLRLILPKHPQELYFLIKYHLQKTCLVIYLLD